jgi:ferredoxin-NADP reductase
MECVAGKYHVAGFSMISPPSQKDRLEFAVKSSKHPVVRYFHDSLKPSEKVWLDAGHGQFYFRKDMSDSVVLIGGGIGTL